MNKSIIARLLACATALAAALPLMAETETVGGYTMMCINGNTEGT